jgi:hypothetical protein
MNNFTILKQFNYFQDDLLSSVGIRHTKEAGLRDCKIAIDSGWLEPQCMGWSYRFLYLAPYNIDLKNWLII